jgi:tRNA modification GTPase
MTAPRLVLRRLSEEGIQPAEPGEFTKRAFLNGKIDLAQAEAVGDMVSASSREALRIALRQLKGGLSTELEAIENQLLDWLVLLEATIDFPEEEIERLDKRALSLGLNSARARLEGLLATHETGRHIKEGFDVTIVGKPNAGKSSLFNRLIGQDRVIVSETPGATRDVVDGLVSVNGVVLKVHDTAGVRNAASPLEEEAVRRTRAAVADSDLTLVVIDLSTPLSEQDREILDQASTKPHLVVINKMDLPAVADVGDMEAAVRVSALEGWGVEDLLENLKEIAHGRIDELGYEVVVNERHAVCIRKSLEGLSRAMLAISNEIPLEFIASDLRHSLDRLGEVTGRDVSTQVLDEIFSRFCIGK